MKKSSLISIIGASVVISASAYFYLTRSEEIEPAPQYSHILFNKVCFHDDFAPGMTAEINYRGLTRELRKTEEGESHASFEIPQEVLRSSSKITLWAIDRDGNRSAARSLSIRDGLIFEN